MIRLPHIPRAALPATALLLTTAAAVWAAVPPSLVLQGNRYIPLASVSKQGEAFVIKVATPLYGVGVSIPMAEVDHVFGDKPVEINQAVALLLIGEPNDAVRLLEPILAMHQPTAKMPGNFWHEAARAALVANALYRKTAACDQLIKEISDATPAPGQDPIGELAKALLLPESTKNVERIDALAALTVSTNAADLCAYACFLRADMLKKAKREPEALEAFLTVACLYPSGGMVINGVAQFRAAEILTSMGRREEALVIATSALRGAKGTVVEESVNKLLQSIK